MGHWQQIKCQRNKLQLIPTLLGGQSFRWKQKSTDEYIGVIGNAVWHLKQTDNFLQFKTYRAESATQSEKGDKEKLKQYLRLDEDIDCLYDSWAESDVYFKESSKKFYAIRILRQDVIENVFSFICSSNNNISRITSMVEKLSQLFGEQIAEVDGTTYYTFPEPSKLSGPLVNSALRTAGFGYRAKYIHETACKINENDTEDWLLKITKLPYTEAKTALMKLSGIGAKVADCICLMSLNHLEAVPVDTHVFQIACERYLPHLKGKKSVTEKIYNEIGTHFRSIFPKYAGWAHTQSIAGNLWQLSKFCPDQGLTILPPEFLKICMSASYRKRVY